jgi:hypothetical protein
MPTFLASMDEVNRQFARPDGSIRYDNVFIWVAGVRD